MGAIRFDKEIPRENVSKARRLPSRRTQNYEVCSLSCLSSRYVFLSKDDVVGPLDYAEELVDGRMGGGNKGGENRKNGKKDLGGNQSVLGVRNRIFSRVMAR